MYTYIWSTVGIITDRGKPVFSERKNRAIASTVTKKYYVKYPRFTYMPANTPIKKKLIRQLVWCVVCTHHIAIPLPVKVFVFILVYNSK